MFIQFLFLTHRGLLALLAALLLGPEPVAVALAAAVDERLAPGRLHAPGEGREGALARAVHERLLLAGVLVKTEMDYVVFFFFF